MAQDLVISKTITLAAGVLTELLPQQSTGERVVWYVRKTTADANECALGIQTDAVANQGIILGAGGRTIDSNSGGYHCSQDRITAISTAGTSVSVFMRATI